jgi:hypothetical protein
VAVKPSIHTAGLCTARRLTRTAAQALLILALGCMVVAVTPWVAFGATSPVEVGSQVVVTDADAGVTVRFDSVTSAGALTVDRPKSSVQKELTNISRVGNTYFDIATTASFGGIAAVTVAYDPSQVKGNEADSVKLFHWDGNAWRDITMSVDAANHTVTGATTSFSDFVVGEATGPVSTPASSWWTVLLAVICGVALAAGAKPVRSGR